MVVRREARASLLAYAFLRNKPLATIERPNSRPPNWDNALRIARKFGGDEFNEAAFREWAGLDPAQAKKAA